MARAHILIYFIVIAAITTASSPAQESTGLYGVVRSQLPEGSFGDPVARAVVTALDNMERVVARSVTAENGAYRLALPAGGYRLTVEHHAYRKFDTSRPVLLVQEGHFTLFNVGLSPKAGGIARLKGRVVAEGDRPVAGADITVTDSDGREVVRSVSEEDGSFSLEVTPGTYKVAAALGENESAPSEPVTIGEGEESDVSLVITPMDRPPGTLQGLVRARAEGGAPGKPIPGATVTATSEDAAVSVPARTNAIGFYQLTVPPGSYRVSVSHADFETAESGQVIDVGSESVRTWNTLLQPLAAGEAVPTCRRQFQVGVGSTYGERHIIYLQITKPGTLSVGYRWAGDAGKLALLVRRPDGQTLRVDGRSPLQLTEIIETGLIAVGSQWEFTVANFGGGRADGTLSVSFPCER